jgi:hypothetical protein
VKLCVHSCVNHCGRALQSLEHGNVDRNPDRERQPHRTSTPTLGKLDHFIFRPMFLAKCLHRSILFQGKREVAAASCYKRGNTKSKRGSNVAKKKPLDLYRTRTNIILLEYLRAMIAHFIVLKTHYKIHVLPFYEILPLSQNVRRLRISQKSMFSKFNHNYI